MHAAPELMGDLATWRRIRSQGSPWFLTALQPVVRRPLGCLLLGPARRRRAPPDPEHVLSTKCFIVVNSRRSGVKGGSLDIVWVKGLKPLGDSSEGTIRQRSAKVSHKNFCFLPLLQIPHDYVLCEDLFG